MIHTCQVVIRRDDKNYFSFKQNYFRHEYLTIIHDLCYTQSMKRKQQARIRRFNNMAKNYPASLEAMSRDRFTCVDCHSTAIDKLLVHHDNQNRKDNALSNLVTLCHRCHSKRHGFVFKSGQQLVQLRDAGLTFQQVADELCISRQRAHQLYTKLKES